MWDSAAHSLAIFDQGVFETDLDEQIDALTPLDSSAMARLLAGLTSGKFRQARNSVVGHLASGQNPGPHDLYSVLQGARDLQQVWQERSVDGDPPSVPRSLATLTQGIDQLDQDLARIGEVVGRDLRSMSFAEIATELDGLRADLATLRVLPSIATARTQFSEAGLGGLIDQLEADERLGTEAEAELDRVWWQSLVDHLMLKPEAEALVAFRGERHSEVLTSFRDLDNGLAKRTAARLRRTAAEHAVHVQDRNPEQAQLVQDQARRKRGHLPVREIFSRAPDVLTALRPCWVMSPLMVSQLIPSDRAYFDVVVFDEASQVRPVDALTSMIRGSQLIVAGDERQLPPTTFFDAAAADGDGLAESDAEATGTADFESLLDVLMTLFDVEMLLWHYRSRDQRLIGFSNQEIYGGDLTTFPGVVSGDVVDHVFVDVLPAEDESRVSPDAEVHRVVELVIEHAKKRPEETLGVIAFGSQHADAIEAGLLAEMPKYPELEEFFAESREERFFVKNLERVQGDERDAIILAVGYGRQADGSLPHRFGPLNNAGGERRLNVAVTRAKRRMTAVSSFRAKDIDPKRSGARGVKLLRSYLAYAERGEDRARWLSEQTALRFIVRSPAPSVQEGTIVWKCSGSPTIGSMSQSLIPSSGCQPSRWRSMGLPTLADPPFGTEIDCAQNTCDAWAGGTFRSGARIGTAILWRQLAPCTIRSNGR